MRETAALLSALPERDIKLWIEHDQLKCSGPAGALVRQLGQVAIWCRQLSSFQDPKRLEGGCRQGTVFPKRRKPGRDR